MNIGVYTWKTCMATKLVDYVTRGADKKDPNYFEFCHNVQYPTKDGAIMQIMQNEEYRPKRVNGNALIHETLSFGTEDSTLEKLNPDIMQDLVDRWLKLRAPDAVAYAVPHFDKGHWHIHVVMHGTGYCSKKSLRLNDEQFIGYRRELEKYQKEMYPQLEASICYIDKPLTRQKDREKEDKNRRKNKEHRFMQDNPGKKTKTQHFSETLAALYQKSFSKESFFDLVLQQEGINLRIRNGKVTGIIDEKTGRAYRFKTLSITPEMLNRLDNREKETVKNRLQQLRKLSDRKSKSRDKDRER